MIGTFCAYIPEEWIFARGVAKDLCLKYLLEDALGRDVKVPDDPQMVGAYGAAIIARDQLTSC